MFLKDPLLELQLFHLREQELQKAVARERLVRSSPGVAGRLAHRFLASLGEVLVGLGERLQEEFGESDEGAAA